MDNLTSQSHRLIAGESIARSTRATPNGLAPEVRRGLFERSPRSAVTCRTSISCTASVAARTTSWATCCSIAVIRTPCSAASCWLSMLYGGAQLWLRWKRVTLTRRGPLELAGVALFGTLLHLAMDALNSYGVHPFWPAENRWFYGDSVFYRRAVVWGPPPCRFSFVVRTTLARVIIGLAPLAALAAGGFLAPGVVAPGRWIRAVHRGLVGRGRPDFRAYRRADQCGRHGIRHGNIHHRRALCSRRIDAIANASFPTIESSTVY